MAGGHAICAGICTGYFFCFLFLPLLFSFVRRGGGRVVGDRGAPVWLSGVGRFGSLELGTRVGHVEKARRCHGPSGRMLRVSKFKNTHTPVEMAWAPQIRRLWQRVAKDCKWKHPRAPAVRKLWKEGGTEAVLEYLSDTRVGCWSSAGAMRAPREAESLGEASEGEEGGALVFCLSVLYG